MKKSLASKGLKLLLGPALTQLILLAGLLSLYSEFELYPQRAAQDCEVAINHCDFTLADARLLHYLQLALLTDLPFEYTLAAKYFNDTTISGTTLEQCWRTLSERRKPLLHPLTFLTGHKDTFQNMNESADAIKAYRLSAERALIDVSAAARLAKSLTPATQAQSIQTTLQQTNHPVELAQAKSSLNLALIHLQAMTNYQEGTTKKSLESSKTRTDALFYLQILGLLNLLNLLITGLLFNENLTKRLQVILQNNQRFSRGQKLLEPVSGDDEIKDLDNTFHEMARVLTENKAIQRVIIDNAQDLICTLDLKGRIIAINAAVIDILGYKAEQMLDTWMLDYIDNSALKAIDDALNASRQGQTTKPFEITALRRDKTQVELLCSLFSQPEQSSIFCIFQNISRSKSAARLQQQVTTLVCDDLQKPIDELMILHQSLKNNELGPVLKDGLRQLEIASSCTSRMQTLIKDLSDSQKADQGNLSITKAIVPIQTIFTDAIDATSALAQAQNIRLMEQHNNLQVFGDANRLIQVLINLIANAIKFSPPNTTITLAARQSQTVTELAVIDQGRGIPAHLIATVFDRFSQAQFADAKVKGGSGLGLAICKSLVELHGGQISVNSVVDKGTTFIITLPNPATVHAERQS
ncbi:MAG: PAS domain S-box protein [Candidatus Obscuribacter sp.]|nr:PAS domain S-box protein [Candidatus Obscuribacter sp.]